MKKYKAKNSSLFLLELIIAILFFSICSAICVQLFVSSHLLTKRTTTLNMALNQATSAAETIKNSSDSAIALSTVFPTIRITTDQLRVYYNAKWSACEQKDATYCMMIDLSSTGSMETGSIKVVGLEENIQLYSLIVEHYRGTVYE